ncbi:type III restriction enzyme, res subunit [Bifidobacterium gallicum DSM 20093 = LMG 11596]|uniref:Type III restriction enzyme, res subunit n=1 Tax=Bifidobacterium gallicum DSM 20093 = LMG 11596 TaxID=561180 RepID=A0A087AEQ0_9BIFI|nr:type III restriction enzyme, res subunit [Bifidobacterium gallicum DSM 20093 = LMG 11596]
MGNFDFVYDVFPDMYDDCALAEAYLHADYAVACFYARRAAYALTDYLYYFVFQLAGPSDEPIALRDQLSDPDFRELADLHLIHDLDIVRFAGNAAAHGRGIGEPDALRAVAALHRAFLIAAHQWPDQYAKVDEHTPFDPQATGDHVALNPFQAQELIDDYDSALHEQMDTIDEQLCQLDEQTQRLEEQNNQIARLAQQTLSQQERIAWLEAQLDHQLAQGGVTRKRHGGRRQRKRT